MGSLRLRTLPIALLGACVLCPSPISADQIYLDDGRVLEGDVISSPGAQTVDLRSASGTMVVIQHFSSAKVLRIAYGPSAHELAISALHQQAKDLEGKAASSAEDWWHLAAQAKELDDTVFSRQLALTTVAHDRQHAEAHKLLGMSLFHGVWMRPAEINVARGQVLWHGSWMTWDQRQTQLAAEEQRHAELAQEQAIRDEQRRIAAAEDEIVEQGELAGSQSSSTASWYPPVYPAFSHFAPLPPGSHTMHWQNFPPGITIHASGGGANSAWSFNWNL